jgi:pimeloyl-ACP methyl ester carboxylesterase
MGMYDIPSVLDYIHNMNKKKIIYIGHSQGTIMLFSALTNKLDYFKTRLALFIALGPVALASKVESLLADYINRVEFENYANKYKYYEYGRMNDRLNKFILHRFPEISHKLMIAMSEKNLQDNNVEWLRVYLAHSPSGTSYKAMNHFKQIGLSNRFQEYDYSGPENVKRYNQSYPPEYDLKKIKDFPIALLAGENDKLCPIENVEWLRDQLGSNVVLYRMYKNMGHMTFLMPKNIDWFDDVMTVMKKYT